MPLATHDQARIDRQVDGDGSGHHTVVIEVISDYRSFLNDNLTVETYIAVLEFRNISRFCFFFKSITH